MNISTEISESRLIGRNKSDSCYEKHAQNNQPDKFIPALFSQLAFCSLEMATKGDSLSPISEQKTASSAVGHWHKLKQFMRNVDCKTNPVTFDKELRIITHGLFGNERHLSVVGVFAHLVNEQLVLVGKEETGYINDANL